MDDSSSTPATPPLSWLGRRRRQLSALLDASRARALFPVIFADTAPLDLRIVGRVVFHAALVGVAAGLVGALFFGSLELLQRVLLEGLAGYVPLRAHGELSPANDAIAPFRPWALVALPALGGLVCGLLTQLAPETRGGGGDAMIDAFHHAGGVIRRRVIWIKALASLSTLSTGGAGGREGPTMQIGGALGSLVGRLLKVSSRERRILLVAGAAGGLSAVFRTPLGAALLAVEILYRDGFESDALIPAVLASVVSYSVVISLFGESTLLAHAPRFPFHPRHLPLYAVLALGEAALAVIFLSVFRRVRRVFTELPVPAWARPALGGLVLGALAVPTVMFVGSRVHLEGHGLGILGGGYGAIQVAVTGASWLQMGWPAVALLFGLALGKLLASSITIGSGGSAGDFAPSLVIGGLAGGAFGRAAQILLADPHLDPGAFALVGMGCFYGGIAHVPLSALVLVCELAGNYDLLVPLMLAQGIAFVALRYRSLYEAQVPTQRDSPVHRETLLFDLLQGGQVRDLMTPGEDAASLAPTATVPEMIGMLATRSNQDVFPVVDAERKVVGLLTAAALRALSAKGEESRALLAKDMMQPAVVVGIDDDLRQAMQALSVNGLRALPVADPQGRLIGFIDQMALSKMLTTASPAAAG